MKIPIKSEKEIKLMQEGGQRLSRILKQLCQQVELGTNLLEIEEKASKLIEKTGGKPSFKMVPGYKWATCLNINEGVVHGVPQDYKLKSGDLLTIDIGLFYKGFHTDTSCTIKITDYGLRVTDYEADNFLKTGRKALKEAIKIAVPGNRVGHISQKIQEIIEKEGYSCVRTLTGHGVGRQLHESPYIPCFLKNKIEDTLELKKGMTLAIEVIYTAGGFKLETSNRDNWTIRTQNGKIAAVFEETVAVMDKPLVLTPLLITG